MTARTTLGALSALALTLPLAGNAQAAPLAGTGENIQPIATLEVDDSQKNELELAGDYAYVNYDDGLSIVDISNPEKPKTVGELKCKGGGWGDIDISADATIAVFPYAHPGSAPCKGAGTAATVVDISDKTKPRIIAKMDKQPAPSDVLIRTDYVHTLTLDDEHKLVYLNPQQAVVAPGREQRIRVFDISNPANPVEKPAVQFTPGVQSVAHDSFVDHRPDGKDIMYAASIHTTDVLDVTTPFEASMKQRTVQPDMTISHQAQPNFDRSMIIVADESLVDQNGEVEGWCGKAGSGAASFNVGSTHFYAAEPDGTFANNGLVKLGSYNKGFRHPPRTCTSHVFWPAPDQNRLTQAWYTEGARIIDFSDPANPTELGHFVADKPTIYWSVKPHRGYLFATDMDRGLDILKYTGEGGAKWPATAGPAEVQRSGFQGVPYVPLPNVTKNSGPLPGATPTPAAPAGSAPAAAPSAQRSSAAAVARAIGRFKFSVRVKAKRRAKLTLSFTDARGKTARTVRFRRGKSSTVRVSGVAEAGKYRWAIKSGRKTLKRGTVTVKAVKGLQLSPNARLTATAR